MMSEKSNLWGFIILGAFICVGLAASGIFFANGLVRFKAMDRTVVAKGLSEREVPANIAIWPIRFTVVDNDLSNLYASVQNKSELVKKFLKDKGFSDDEIFASALVIRDRAAEGILEGSNYRYSATSTVTVYSEKVDSVRNAIPDMVELGKLGIVISGSEYYASPSYLFTNLNDIKPAMIEEATIKAREVAEKFAKDSKSKLGAIKRANQGSFQIEDRDESTPYIKRVRIVSTVEYFLSD